MDYVVCIDGTGNWPGQKIIDPLSLEEVQAPTNVYLAWVEVTAQVGPLQNHHEAEAPLVSAAGQGGRALYLAGVGTDALLSAFHLATGAGTDQLICKGYRFLAAHYRKGDRIFCFGYSRGAYAVRSLAGFIEHTGLPAGSRAVEETEVLRLYRDYLAGRAGAVFDEASAHFLGLWDTVGSLLFQPAGHNINPKKVGFVAHALALDEIRESFLADCWMPRGMDEKRVKEVWFPGSHGNVGGGYADHNLSNIAFFWVMKCAEQHGLGMSLTMHPRWYIENPSLALNNSLTDSWKQRDQVYRFMRDGLRSGKLPAAARTIQDEQRIHQSVLDRMGDPSVLPPYTPIARSVDSDFWKQTQDQAWHDTWVEPWNC